MDDIKIWHIYIIKSSKDDSYYTGITTDVAARFKTHNEGKGARYTRGRGPFTLLYSKAIGTKSEASKREYAIKQLSRSEKEELINESNS